MGWLFSYDTSEKRPQLLARLRRPERFAPDNELLRSSAIGNNHWYLAKHIPTGRIWIGLDLMKGGGRTEGWGYKDLDESMGPCEVNCPITYLDLASEPEGYAIEWRQRVRAHHAAKKARPKYEPGLEVEVSARRFRLIEPIGRRGWRVKEDTGDTYRMSFRTLSQCAVVQP